MTVFSAATAGDQITFVAASSMRWPLPRMAPSILSSTGKATSIERSSSRTLSRAGPRLLAATDATDGLLVFATSGRIERLRRLIMGHRTGARSAKHVRETPLSQ